jgi:hypothetical protein
MVFLCGYRTPAELGTDDEINALLKEYVEKEKSFVLPSLPAPGPAIQGIETGSKICALL